MVVSVNKSTSKEVISQIHKCVEEGCTKVEDVKKNLAKFVESLPLGKTPSFLNRQYFPANKTIYNHIQIALASKSEADGSQFLLVVQTTWQQQLMHKFGKVLLVDSTFDTCKYRLPLFELVINTNVGYVPIAICITEDETEKTITEALTVLTSWNPTWVPKVTVTDCHAAQSNALHAVFPAFITTYTLIAKKRQKITELIDKTNWPFVESRSVFFTFYESQQRYCKFHTEQAWKRWLSRIDNGLIAEQDEVLSHLRSIANSISPTEVTAHIEELKTKVKLCLHTVSLSADKFITSSYSIIGHKWIRAYRNLDENIVVTTTNGVEVHHRVLKSLLKDYGMRSLQSLVEIIVNRYFKDCLKSYVEKNVKAKSLSKFYSSTVPEFLHDRPKRFVDHCLGRLSDALMYNIDDIDQVSSSVYTVKSQTEKNIVYTVCLNVPSCDCIDFKMNFMPCKHLIASILQFKCWEEVSHDYAFSPYYTINDEFLDWINNLNDNNSTVVQQYQSNYSNDADQEIKIAKNMESIHVSATKITISSRTKANAQLNKIRNYINNTNSENAIQNAIELLNFSYKSLLTRHGSVSMIRNTNYRNLKRLKVPQSFIKRRRRGTNKRKVVRGHRSKLNRERKRNQPTEMEVNLPKEDLELSGLKENRLDSNAVEIDDDILLPEENFEFSRLRDDRQDSNFTHCRSTNVCSIKVSFEIGFHLKPTEMEVNLPKDDLELSGLKDNRLESNAVEIDDDILLPEENFEFSRLRDDRQNSNFTHCRSTNVCSIKVSFEIGFRLKPTEMEVNLPKDDLELSGLKDNRLDSNAVEIDDDILLPEENLEFSRLRDDRQDSNFTHCRSTNVCSIKVSFEIGFHLKPTEMEVNLPKDDLELSGLKDNRLDSNAVEIDDDILLPKENLVFSRLRDNRQDSNFRHCQTTNMWSIKVSFEIGFYLKEPIIPDLMEVWDHHSDSECLMASIGQRKLLGTSFGMLRPDEDVPDEIIHAYLDILKRHNSGIETIDCFEMGRIIKTPDEAKHLLLKASI
ncbi:hypothetical protein KUTeg_007924 [Tegillarca granosa]|uniref:SWIM-type domain-containing protein n=1 Tax=Tegillarca granosa TaxID=220873 RepID=A0ABQ9FEM5_TEGGR|nr:hypothetical protein KUTeg_007924 [Tegillarca granosa]